MMKKFLSIILSSVMVLSSFNSVFATETDTENTTAYESVLLSSGKPVECGIDGSGSEHSDMANFGSASVMVDGKTTGSTQSLMWYLYSTNGADTMYLNVDLQDIYMITKIDWKARYATTAKSDYRGMKIYGANKEDYSDKTLIYTAASDATGQNAEFTIAEEDISEYRYIRFEKQTYMGGQELYIYGYQIPESNARLSTLEVSGYSLDSAFAANDTEYTIFTDALPANNTVTVTATAENENATVAGTGDITVDSYGVTEIPVTVTSANGKIRTYTIKFVVVETQLLSQSKPIGFSMDGVGTLEDSIGSVELMVDGDSLTNSIQGKMWYVNSATSTDVARVAVDLEKAYMITKITWSGRYATDTANTTKYDYQNMTIYGANNDDYSDKVKIYTIGADVTTRDVTCDIAAADIAEYRYVIFEKKETMGGQELKIYGYDASNADLASLSVDGYTFDSEFSADDTEYTVISSGLPTDNTVTVSAQASGVTASVAGAGSVTVDSYGTTVIPVTVTTENGTEKVYTINFVAIKAALLSSGKVPTYGILKNADEELGTEHSDMANFGSASVMVDGKTTGSTQSLMWYLHTTVDGNMTYLNLDLEDSYMITKIAWRGRYDTTEKTDYRGMKIYGANKEDYSDKTLIYTIPIDADGILAECPIATADIAEYRYIRFEKVTYMGGQELYVYGYDTSNADLASLSVDGYTLDSEFSADDTEYTVMVNGLPTDGKVTVNAEADVTTAEVSGNGEVLVNYGINEIPVTVTTENGTKKIYTLKLIVMQGIDISAGATAKGEMVLIKSGAEYELDDTLCTNLFTSSVTRGDVHIKWEDKGYIQVDLGKPYNLCAFKFTKSSSEKTGALTITASTDAEFTYPVTLGTTTALTKTQTNGAAALNSDNAYQYVRIEKNFNNADFLPLSMRLYAMPEITQETVENVTEVTVPSRFYKVGDKVVGAVYTNTGALKSVTFVPAENAATTSVSVTKQAGETAKVMILDSFISLMPRVEAYDVK